MDFLKKFLGKRLSREHFNILVAEGAVIVDVRSPNEFKEEGHLPDAMNIPLQFIVQKAEQFKEKDATVITVCRQGIRSSMAVSLLSNAGVRAFNGGSWSSFS
ncbi:rhodanese-like domain-containing protein [Foetidibacter luteolus]|uniref:rhodanese-like domain-containing protein n=1 Tax=Foetidibacter luteolus TaxID=2608880 RepID=UPI00129B935C|nr:rhodanese-like domain-containing protein [Foetidibacter luteolus]